MSGSKKAEQARVAIGPDVATSQTLIDRGGVVGEMAVKTSLYTSNAAFRSTIDDFVSSTVDLAAAEKKVTSLDAALTQARSDRDQQRFVTEDCHGAAVKQVERHSKTAADVHSYGFVHLDIIKAGAILPVGIDAAFQPKTRILAIRIRYPPGIKGRRVILEISTDPIGPATYHRLDGDGARRELTGYAPGTYWVRAATSVAGGRSDWFGPVSVIVT